MFSLTFTDIFSQSQKIIILKVKKEASLSIIWNYLFSLICHFITIQVKLTHTVLLLLLFFPRLFPDDMFVDLPCGLQWTGHFVLLPFFQNKQAPEPDGEYQLFSSVLLILAFLWSPCLFITFIPWFSLHFFSQNVLFPPVNTAQLKPTVTAHITEFTKRHNGPGHLRRPVQVTVSQQGAAPMNRTWPSGRYEQNRANWLPLLSLTTDGRRSQIISHTETDCFIISVNAFALSASSISSLKGH